MKKIILVLSILVFSLSSHAENLSNKIAETTSGYISNLIPGEGTTEVSIQLRENFKFPSFLVVFSSKLTAHSVEGQGIPVFTPIPT